MSDEVLTQNQSLVGVPRGMEGELRRRGIEDAALFSALPRGDDGEVIVDIVVHLEPGRRFTLIDLVRVEELIASRIGATAHVTTWNAIPEAERARILQEAVSVF